MLQLPTILSYYDHIFSFLEGPKAALTASKDFDNGHYKTTPQHGIRAFGRAYSAWAYSQEASIYSNFRGLSHALI